MSLKIHFPKVGNGDCIIAIRETDEGVKQSLMVDCGMFNDEVRHLVVDELGKHIDCLVVTHFDDDHILGITKMLQELTDLTIEKILFNCKPIMDGVEHEMPEDERVVKLNAVLQKLATYEPHDIEQEVSAGKATSLASLLFGNFSWYEAWRQADVIRTEHDEDAIYLGEMGKLYILSPTMTELRSLSEKYKSDYTREFFKRVEKSNASLYEVILRLDDIIGKRKLIVEHATAGELCNAGIIRKLSTTDDGSDNSENNASSIAFVWEINGKRILLTGDATAEVLKDGLSKYREIKGLEQDSTILFDLIKLPHHGSKFNSSRTLLKSIDSKEFVTCGQFKDTTPDLSTYARIICRPLADGIEERNLIFNLENYRNKSIAEFISNHIDADETIRPYTVTKGNVVTL